MSISPPRAPRKGTGGRPTKAAAAGLAELILETGWRMFMERGYARLSVDAIAAAASVSKRTIYDRFESKEKLFEALVTRAATRWAEQGSTLGEAYGEDWLERLGTYLLDLTSSPDILVLNGFMATEGHLFPRVVTLMLATGDEGLDGLAEYLRQRLDHYPDGQAGRLLARSIMAHVYGWAALYPEAQPKVSDAEVRQRVCKELRGLLELYGCTFRTSHPGVVA
jgi:AcrR family transcriptional regulator